MVGVGWGLVVHDGDMNGRGKPGGVSDAALGGEGWEGEEKNEGQDEGEA